MRLQFGEKLSCARQMADPSLTANTSKSTLSKYKAKASPTTSPWSPKSVSLHSFCEKKVEGPSTTGTLIRSERSLASMRRWWWHEASLEIFRTQCPHQTGHAEVVSRSPKWKKKVLETCFWMKTLLPQQQGRLAKWCPLSLSLTHSHLSRPGTSLSKPSAGSTNSGVDQSVRPVSSGGRPVTE